MFAPLAHPALADDESDEMLDAVADRGEQDAARPNLLEERVGNFSRGTGQIAGVVGGVLGPPLAAVAGADVDVVPKVGDAFACRAGQPVVAGGRD